MQIFFINETVNKLKLKTYRFSIQQQSGALHHVHYISSINSKTKFLCSFPVIVNMKVLPSTPNYINNKQTKTFRLIIRHDLISDV